ncbi:MAG TPA: electron transfer flavoprotein subunit beta/FixA family protein, partial [Rubricoccaceae bacterium]|nr:electron transfer flavoprotein subunit beta/FixA family protein [Rubricoccaceae bacterium]
TLKGVMGARSKPIEKVPVAEVPAPAVQTLGYEPLPERAPGRRLDGEPAEQATEVARLLHEEARVL